MQKGSTDFTQTLKAAIVEARAAGLDSAAAQLEGRCFAVYTTSSEWLGEVGLAIAEFRRNAGTGLPPSVIEKLDACMREVRKVWPGLRAGK